MYVGMDVHKKTIQVSVVDENGSEILNEKIGNSFESIRNMVTRIPEGAKYVMESSSVWYGTFRYMRDEMGCDMTLSNPFNTKIIATSLKKTDRVDAFQLANMLRGGYIAKCHVPSEGIMSLLHNTPRTVQNSSTRTKYLHRKS